MSEVSFKPAILPVEVKDLCWNCRTAVAHYVHRSAVSSSKLKAFMFLLVC